MDHAAAAAFATRWAADWNAHDLDAVLAHFADDVVFTSPVASQVVPGSEGVISGRDALREYWTRSLERIPDFHVDVVGVYAGVSTVVIAHRNHTGALVCEVLEFDDDVVVMGHGTYLTDDAAGVSGVTPA